MASASQTVRVGNYIYVSGLRQIAENIRDLDDAIRQRIIWKGLNAGARVVVIRAKQTAPQRTGAMRRSVSKRAWAKDGQFKYAIGVEHGVTTGARLPNPAFGRPNVTLFKNRTDDAYYWRWVELGYHAVGSRPRTLRKGNVSTRGEFIPGQEFLQDAQKNTASKQLRVLAATMRIEIRRLKFTAPKDPKPQGITRTPVDPRLLGRDAGRFARSRVGKLPALRDSNR